MNKFEEEFKQELKEKVKKAREKFKEFDSELKEIESVITAIEVSRQSIDISPPLKHYAKTLSHEDAAKLLGISKHTLQSRLQSKSDWRVVTVSGRLRCVRVD